MAGAPETRAVLREPWAISQRERPEGKTFLVASGPAEVGFGSGNGSELTLGPLPVG